MAQYNYIYIYICITYTTLGCLRAMYKIDLRVRVLGFVCTTTAQYMSTIV
jgi:hypothetical protein